MDNSEYSEEYIKDEPFSLKDDEEFFSSTEMNPSAPDDMFTSTSACVPIPGRKASDINHIRDTNMDYLLSPVNIQDSDTYPTLNNPLWSSRIDEHEERIIKMEDDDIFQVDKSDLIQDTQLSDLHVDQHLLDELCFDELLPGELGTILNIPTFDHSNYESNILYNTPVSSSFNSSYGSSFLTESTNLYRDSGESFPSSPLNATSNNSKTFTSLDTGIHSPSFQSPTNTHKHTTLHELLLRKDPGMLSPGSPSILGQSVPGANIYNSRNISMRPNPSRLSSSAPTHSGMDHIWQRREPRKHLLSTGSLAEAGSTSSLSTSGLLSPDAFDFSLDDAYDSEEDSDQEYDFSSDADSSDGEGGGSSRSSKKDKYFWQYNVQSKGPKGQRLVLKTQLEDPHCLNEIQDPVFSPDCSLQGIKHSGKARKGDGNDLTPNPRKLQAIGKELDKLNRVINDMTPVSELPFNVRPNTRKEKNKLASRACRLKKKAQHEANKIKLLGLETEHKRLLGCISQVQQLITTKARDPDDNQDMVKMVEKVTKHAAKLRIAGQTTEFVNKVLEKLKCGVPNGGLDELYLTGYTSAIPATPGSDANNQLR